MTFKMEIHVALHETLRLFKPKLSATEIANRANVSQAAISQFRRGERDLYVGTLQRIINALPEDIKQHFFSRLFDIPDFPVRSSDLEPTAFAGISPAMSFSDIGQALTEAGKNMMSARGVGAAVPQENRSEPF